MIKKKKDMYIMYEEYKRDLKNLRKLVAKHQKRNAELRYKERNLGEQYVFNKNTIDITIMNSMIRDIELDLEMIEGYLDYDDRFFTHKKAKDYSDKILSSYTNNGFVPDGEILYAENIDNVQDLICNVELQDEIVELLDKVLTERQRQVVKMYFWNGITQEKIAKKLGVNQSTITRSIQDSLELLKNNINISEMHENYLKNA